MNVTVLFSQTWKLCRENIVVLVPLIVPALVFMLGSLIVPGAGADPMAAMEAAGRSPVFILLITILNVLVSLVAQGMSVIMAQEVYETGNTSISSGWSNILSRILPLAIATALFSILFAIGLLLVVLPGLVVGFFLIFRLPEVVVAEKGPIPALLGSVKLVAHNSMTVAIVFLILFALGIIIVLISAILGFIPVVGPIVGAIIGAVYTGFSGIFVLQVYQQLTGEHSAPGDVEI